MFSPGMSRTLLDNAHLITVASEGNPCNEEIPWSLLPGTENIFPVVS